MTPDTLLDKSLSKISNDIGFEIKLNEDRICIFEIKDQFECGIKVGPDTYSVVMAFFLMRAPSKDEGHKTHQLLCLNADVYALSGGSLSIDLDSGMLVMSKRFLMLENDPDGFESFFYSAIDAAKNLKSAIGELLTSVETDVPGGNPVGSSQDSWIKI